MLPDMSASQTGSPVDSAILLKNIPRGRPKSGRLWKTTRTNRYSEIKKDKPLRSSWSEKMARKAEQKSVKNLEKELKEGRTKELEEKRKRQEEKKKRKMENEKKSEIVQTIKNTAKIKRMKKKQLRQIEKR
ncbi:hypothetical protein ScPMuIL_006828 [Solemya velum]